MGKLESNKLQKRTSLLNTAFNLFTTKGVSKTSIAEISKNAGIAKGTFYLYFKDKYDIRNKLVSHESSKLFKHAAANLTQYCLKNNLTLGFEDKIIFIADHIINALNEDKTLLTFISKNLSWGIFREALTSNIAEDDVNFKDVFYSMIDCAEYEIEEPEIMLFLITELVSPPATAQFSTKNRQISKRLSRIYLPQSVALSISMKPHQRRRPKCSKTTRLKKHRQKMTCHFLPVLLSFNFTVFTPCAGILTARFLLHNRPIHSVFPERTAYPLTSGG